MGKKKRPKSRVRKHWARSPATKVKPSGKLYSRARAKRTLHRLA